MISFRTVALAASLSMAMAAVPSAADVPLPRGVHVRMTFLGPVFTDDRGMTLYTTRMDAKPGESTCNSDRPRQVTAFNSTFVYTLPDVDRRRTCAEKSPPLPAPRAARPPSPDWTVIERTDHSLQWAYQRKPLYTSSKDVRPGDVNGEAGFRWSVARAPLPDTPPGVTVKQSTHGVILAAAGNRTLYLLPDGVDACAGNCAREWVPLAAPLTNEKMGDWSVSRGSDGMQQWRYRGSRVFMHERDIDPDDMYGLRDKRARLIVLQPPPRHPAEITTHRLKGHDIYADRDGRTLYVFNCNEEAKDGLACDDPGDSPLYRASYCGTACNQVWRPVAAPPNAKPIDGVWSRMLIDPDDPMRKVTDPRKALGVWAYRGRPVFTYARDLVPGDTNGQLLLMPVSSWNYIYTELSSR